MMKDQKKLLWLTLCIFATFLHGIRTDTVIDSAESNRGGGSSKSTTTTTSKHDDSYDEIIIPPIPLYSIPEIQTYIPGIRSDGLCDITVGYDYTDDKAYINNGRKTVLSIDQECCIKCQENEDCMSWTYYNKDDNDRGYKSGECWMSSAYKKEGQPCNLCSSTHFGVLDDTLSDIYENIAFQSEFGLLNEPDKHDAKDAQDCILLCEKTESCIAWTYIKKDDKITDSKKGECYLRSFAPYFVPAPYADSGLSLSMKIQMCKPNRDTCFDSEYGYVNGPDYEITKSNEECAYLCQMVVNCRSWLRVHTETAEHPVGTCILRDWVPMPYPCDYADSGKDTGFGPTEHVILIIADDMGIDHLGIYKDVVGDDARDVYPYTPNMDYLLHDGVIFNNAYSNPTCSPSRASILTGQYGFRTGIGYPIGAICSDGLDGNSTTIPNVLPEVVSKGAVGKWHISSFGADLDIPRTMGFDRFEGFIDGTIFDYYSWDKTINGDPVTKVYAYCTTDMVNAVDRFFDTMESDQWFLWMAFNAPHTPFHKPPDELHYHPELLDVDPLEFELDPVPYFHAMIEALDTELGRIWNFVPIEKQERTTVIFIGDNGSPKEVSDGHPFDEDHAKETLTEGGIRVPFAIIGAGVRNGGRQCDDLVNIVDLFPTIIQLFGSKIPEDYITDGISLLPVMMDQDYERRTFAYAEAFGPGRTCDNPANGFIFDYGQIIRNYKFKLFCPIYYDEDTGEETTGVQEMFDLRVDPWEKDNLLDEHGAIREDLDEAYKDEIYENRIELESKIDEFNELRALHYDDPDNEMPNSNRFDNDVVLENKAEFKTVDDVHGDKIQNKIFTV